MAPRELVVEHDLDTPPAIAWAALTDQELVSGWMGNALIDAVTDGRYAVAWLGRPGYPGFDGRIDVCSPSERLVLAVGRHGTIEFVLEEEPGGLRGTWTRLRITIDTGEADRVADLRDRWQLALGQLDEVLRGHPTDWSVGRRSPNPVRDAGSA